VDTDKNILFWPARRLKALQDKKLHHFITRHLYPFSPYYRRLFDRQNIKPASIRTAEDLRRIPFTTKETFLELIRKDPMRGDLAFYLQPDEALMRRFLPRAELMRLFFLSVVQGRSSVRMRFQEDYKPIFLTATAGTTGRPISFLYARHDIENLHTYGRRLTQMIGVEANDLLFNVFPYSPHLAFWQAVFGGIAANVFTLSTGGGKTLGTEGNIRSIMKIRPKFLIGVPSYVYHILKTAREEGLDFSFMNRIVLGAGRTPVGFKRKLAGFLQEMGARDVTVFGTYGFTEARASWGECPTPMDVTSGYHTYPDMEVFEVVDPETQEPKKEGETGELVYTNIDSRGTCVLRYRTGDIVEGGIVYAPCPHCGRTVPRISSDITRASNIKTFQFSKLKGALVNLNNVTYILDDDRGIDEWQIEIVKKGDDPYEVDELVLFVSLSRDLDREKFTEELNQKLLSSEEVSFNRIHFVSRDEMKHRIEIEFSLKTKKIVDKRPEV